MESKENLGLVVSFIVRHTDGSIDRDATVLNFTNTLEQYEVEREVENAQIGEAVDQLFDQYPGANIQMEFIERHVCNTLGATLANSKFVSDRTAEYIRSLSPGWKSGIKVDEAKEQGYRYFVGRGRGVGGVRRLCDYTPKPKDAK